MNTFKTLVILLCLLCSQAFGATVTGRISIQPAAPQAADTTPPVIAITTPDLQRSLTAVVKDSSFTVIGKASDSNGIADVTVNSTAAILDAQGNFSAAILLKVGDNRITVTALDTRGNRATRSFTLNRAPAGSVAIATTEPAEPEHAVRAGSYYALLIAVEEYASQEINRLDHPVRDAVRLGEILKQHYTFDEQNIVLLKNPDRKTISRAFNDLRKKLTEKDNLLIFYAGHGIWLDDMQEGYWLPQDASGVNDPTDWIANSTIRNYIRALKAKHVLLVADACFSGGIFKVRDAFGRPDKGIETIYAMPSRKAITSGSLKTVPDRSVFIEYLTKRLRENAERYLDAQKLFVSFKEAVINNSPSNQTPLYGAISEAGDEGGDFIFVKRP